MKLEEAIKKLQDLKDDVELGFGGWTNRLSEKEQLALETVLQALENSIPKEITIEKLENIQLQYEECVAKSNMEELMNISMPVFKGIQLEAQREILQKILKEN